MKKEFLVKRFVVTRHQCLGMPNQNEFEGVVERFNAVFVCDFPFYL